MLLLKLPDKPEERRNRRYLIVGLCLLVTWRQSSIKAAISAGASSGTLRALSWPLMGTCDVQISQRSTPAGVHQHTSTVS